MKYTGIGFAVLIGVVAALSTIPAQAGDVSIGVGIGGFSVGAGGHGPRFGHHWRGTPRFRHHGRRHWHGRHHGPYLYGTYGYYVFPYAYDQSVDYVAEPDYPESKAPAAEPYCREFTRDIVIDGKTVQAYGRACRQEDGSWKIVE